MNKTTLWVASFVLLAGGLALGAAHTQNPLNKPVAHAPTPEVLLQRAIQKETVDGDLGAAIKLYREILANPGPNRAVPAQALLHLGQCNEKLGNAEARKAYEQLVRDYADQSSVAAEGRARLAALGGAGSAGVAGGSTRVDRRVWAMPGVGSDGRISPDGRFLSYTDWDTGDLAILDFTTGQSRHLTSKGSWATSAEEADVSLFSPDGRQVLYNWYNKDGYYDLRTIGIDGSNPKIVFANRGERFSYITPLGWQPAGGRVLADFQRGDDTHAWVQVSIGNGDVRVLKEGTRADQVDPQLSPDGRQIAYGLDGKISILDLETGLKSPIYSDAGSPGVVAWAPDGRHLLFKSSRSGGRDLWLLEIAGGHSVGEPTLLKKDFTGYSLGFARSGAFYYVMTDQVRDVQIAEIDHARGGVASAAQRASKKWVGVTRSPDWSPDGKSLAYVKDRTPGQTIVIRSTESGEERELELNGLRLGLALRWMPDGQGLLTTAIGRGTERNFVRIDPQTAQVTNIMPVTGADAGFPRFEMSRDGKTLYRAKASLSDQNVGSVVAHDLTSGRETTLLEGKGLSFIAASPDGQRLAVIGTDNLAQVLMVMPAAGGAPREVTRVPADQANWRVPPVWTPDGHSIVFVKGLKGRPTSKVEIWRVPVDGGQPQPLGLTVDELWWLRIHPDGRRVAIGAWKTSVEIWVMENFLPPSKR